MAETSTDTPRRGRSPREAALPIAPEPPHSAELERSVLAVLLDGRHPTAVQVLRPKAEHPLVFYERDHRLIYLACLDLDDRGMRIDAQAVAEHLRRTRFQAAVDRLRQQQALLEAGSLDLLTRVQRRQLYAPTAEDEAQQIEDSALAAIGGYAALARLAGSYASFTGLERNVELLVDDYLKRRLIRSLSQITDTAYRTTETFTQLVDASSLHLLSLAKMGQGAEIHDMTATVDDALAQIQHRADNPQSGVQTGYAEIDDMLMSLRPGGLYVLAARPGAGKTSFALSVVQHVCRDAEQPTGALFFSLEVDRLDLVKKLIAGKAQIDFKKLETGRLEDAEWQALADAAEDLKQWKLDLMDVSDLTVQGLRSITKRHMLEKHRSCGVVVIDYLQLLGSTKAGISEYEKISEISRTLKIIAREMSVPVLALSQMSRDSERAAGKPRPPRLSDLRGSGSIEQDADAVIFLHREEDGQDREAEERSGRLMKLILAKNRFGPIGACDMRFFPGRQRFVVVPRNEMAPGGAMPPAPPPAERHERYQKPVDDGAEDLFPA